MSNKQGQSLPSVPSASYTHDYYVHCCQGYEEFSLTAGAVLPARIKIPLDLAGIKPGMNVLDVGCGRGELLVHSARLGAKVWGMDYAQAAVDLTAQLLANPAYDDLRPSIHVMRSSALDLPYPSQQFDVAFMLDVVEHLYPAELQQAFAEIYRVLRPGGRLIIHTMPNLWYYWYGYPIYRLLQRARGQVLPGNPRQRWDYHEVHVNEQTPPAMAEALRHAGYKTRVWLRTTQSYAYEKNALVRYGMGFVTQAPLLRRIFCNDIFAVGTK